MSSRAKERALKVLGEAEARHHGLEAKRGPAMEHALKEHLADREPLLQRRYELVSGISEPEPEELEGYKGPGPDTSAAKGKGLPYFWLNVLRSQDLISSAITPRDAKALAYLNDVRFVRGVRGLLVEFLFRDNPYFDNKVLRRGVYVEFDASGQPIDVREEATDIEWQDGMSLLVREVKSKGKKSKKGKKGKKGAQEQGEGEEEETGGRKRFKPCPSFFRFFTPLGVTEEDKADPTLEDEEEVDQEEQEGAEGEEGQGEGGAAAALNLRRQKDSDMLEVIVKQVIPKAMHLYLEGGAMEGGRHGQDVEEEEEEADEGFEVVSSSMKGAHGGDVSSLSAHAQTVVHALKGLQAKIDALAAKFKTAKWEIKAQAERDVQELADQRAQLVAGDAQDGPPAIPNFWLRALRGMEVGIDCIHRRDERALSYLKDVRFRWDFTKPMPTPEQPTRYATVELHFRPGNPFFPNPVLRKLYTFQGAGGSTSRLSLASSEVLDAPQWAEGKDLTVKAVPGAEGKTKPAASFFALFKKGALRQAFNIVGEDRQSQQEAIRMEEELLNELQSSLMHRAFTLYDMVDLDDELPEEGEDDDDEGEEEEEEEEEEGEEGDERAKLLRRRQRARAARARPMPSDTQGPGQVFRELWEKVSGSWLLMLLLAVVALGQVLAVVEVIPYVRAFLGYR